MPSLEKLLAYLPPDRLVSIAAGRELPRQARGTALCADLSGFTLLTETLARKLGKRRGVEELALQLNRFYEALIASVDAYGGSVIDFSGDAINCWFEADDGRRALTAAQAMQVVMQPFTSLQLPTGDLVSVGVKITIASGSARRFMVGDPAIQLLDTLAGSIMDRLAVLGHLAGTGEILADEATVVQLQALLQINEWRVEAGQRAAVVGGLNIQVEPTSKALLPNLAEKQVRPWLLPAVFARLQGGQGEFLTELRPAAALFLRFDGLDYDGDEQAGEKLDEFIRWVQDILVEYEGTLLQLTLGDKGSYLYAAFGAPVAHENDVERAAMAALALCLLPFQLESIQSVSIGLSHGTMRTGAYGSVARRTYGVLGDEVNLAARLMQRAAPGQILASQTVWQAASDFDWQVLPAFEAKGKRVAVTPAALLGWREREAFHVHQSIKGSPMIGRQAELALLEEKFVLAHQGQGQIVSVTAEAGMGKSRLLAEVLGRASELTQYGGECQSYGTQSAYLVWHTIWRAFFGLDRLASTGEQIETLERALAQFNPDFLLRLPLLGAVLNLSIPDNGLTAAMDARARKTSCESLLVDCIRAQASQTPFVLVLEDLHWIDPLSRDLLELIGRAIKELPVLVLLAYRPPVETETTFLPGLAGLEYATKVPLAELTRVEIEELVAARLVHFGLVGDVPPALVERLSARAQGNPFYIEELLNYLHDCSLDPRLEASWQQADLPDSLHRLILSRIDRLAERQQITIKTASIIGRLFQAAWLYGYYPSLGSPAQISADLETLRRLDFTLMETPEPHLAYLFKHVITQEAAYESLAYATRATLHEQFARYLELTAGEDVGPFLDLLAYHYEHSENLPKKREYLRKAGKAAQVVFANEAALSYLERALALAPETDYAERFALVVVREQVYGVLGKREAQEQDVAHLKVLAETLDDNDKRAHSALHWSRYALSAGNFPEAIIAAHQAAELAHLVHADEIETCAYWLWGRTLWFQGNYTEARMRYEQALVIAETANITTWIAVNLGGLGSLDMYGGNYDSAQTYLERALQLHRQTGNLEREAATLYNLGEIADLRGDFAEAQAYHEQTLSVWRSISYQINEGRSLSRVASMIIEQRGDYEKAELYTKQALRLSQELNDRIGKVGALYGLSLIDLIQHNYQAARIQAEQGLRICREIGFKYFEGMCLTNLGAVADELGEYPAALEYYQNGLSILRELGEPSLTSQILTELGRVFYHLGKHEAALEYNQQALSIADEKVKLAQTRALISQGHMLRELDNLDPAADFYQQALRIALELGFPDCYTKQAQTGLAAVALAQGKLTESQVSLDGILHYLETTQLSTIDEIFWIYLTCYRILQAIADPRARSTLSAAHHLLQEIAARIDDEALRTSFLQNVRANREIIEAWQSYA
jgi:class 3 adenylate cyclase/tetratricopeptide (TPR) repeat protein